MNLEKSPGRFASDHQSSTLEEDEFEKELDLIERRRLSSVRNNANGELDKMKGALNKNIEKIIEIGRLKGETVWGVIKQLEEPLLYGTNPKCHAGYPSVRGAIVFFHEIHFE